MKLKGYIKAIKENCFAIPIYSDGTSYYHHNISKDFKILSFEKIEICEEYFIQIYLSKNFEINSIGAIIFAGFDNYLLADSADKIINEIIYYLNDLSKVDEYLNIKKEALELKKIIIFNFKINESEIDNKGIVRHSLEEYLQKENSSQNKHFLEIKERIIKRQIENSIIDDNLFSENKEVLFQLFCNYLSDNKLVFEKLMINTDIGKNFTSYLSINSESYKSNKISIEETLRLRAIERKKAFKALNHKFNSDNTKQNLDHVSAYKRFGFDINHITHNIDEKTSKVVIFIDDKMVSDEINKIKTQKKEELESLILKLNK